MQIKRFYAVSLPAAIRDVRRMLGPDAVILSTRSLTTEDARTLVNVGNAKVEVTAARESPESASPTLDRAFSRVGGIRNEDLPSQAQSLSRVARAREATGRIPRRETFSASAEPAWADPPEPLKVGTSPSARNAPALYADSVKETPKSGQPKPFGQYPWPESPDRSARAARENPVSHPKNGAGKVSREMRAILLELRALSVELGKSADAPPKRESSHQPTACRAEAASPVRSDAPPLASGRLAECLRAQGVDDGLIQRLVARMDSPGSGVEKTAFSKTGLSMGERRESSFGCFVQAVGDLLASRSSRSSAGPPPRRIALAGPTGVGKTTTIAKIAARCTLQENKTVALITLDTYRVAAADQLKTYARLLRVPIEVVSEYGRFGEALERFEEADLVLIDTPGCSPSDRSAILRLGAALSGDPLTETHLVIPAGLRLAEMRRTLNAFRPLRFERAIFSKLDETVSWGDLLNAWILDGLDVSYFTMGQRVPEDLGPASLELLCRSLLAPEPTPAPR